MYFLFSIQQHYYQDRLTALPLQWKSGWWSNQKETGGERRANWPGDDSRPGFEVKVSRERWILVPYKAVIQRDFYSTVVHQALAWILLPLLSLSSSSSSSSSYHHHQETEVESWWKCPLTSVWSVLLIQCKCLGFYTAKFPRHKSGQNWVLLCYGRKEHVRFEVFHEQRQSVLKRRVAPNQMCPSSQLPLY